MNEEMLKNLLENDAAMAAMPPETRNALRAQYEQMKGGRERREREEEARRKQIDEANRKNEDRIKKRREEIRREVLGLNIGEWTRNIPRNRRFVLAKRIGRRFTGCCWHKQDESMWVNRDEYVPMDILRGYTFPYFAYCGSESVLDEVVRESLMSAIEAETEDKLAYVCEHKFNFFKYEKEDDERYRGIAICEFNIDECGHTTIVGHGEYKSLEQHFSDLKREFGT